MAELYSRQQSEPGERRVILLDARSDARFADGHIAGAEHLQLSDVDRELGRANFALQYSVGRPSNILRACTGEQVEKSAR